MSIITDGLTEKEVKKHVNYGKVKCAVIKALNKAEVEKHKKEIIALTIRKLHQMQKRKKNGKGFNL